MYANALKRVFDEDDEAFQPSSESVTVPMEIKKIDDYDGRVKKFYSSAAETPKSSNYKASMEDHGSMGGAGTATTNEHFYPSSSTQKSSRKTLRITLNNQ